MTVELDARGLKCPLPVLKARKALKTVPLGETLEVAVTDPGAPQDFIHFCTTTGHDLVSTVDFGQHWVISIKRVV